MKLNRPKYKNFKPGQFPDRSSGFDVVELKYDGWWGQLVLEGREWKLYSRIGQLKREGPLQGLNLTRTVVHGEWIFGTEWADQHPEYHGQLALHSITESNGVLLDHWPVVEQRNHIRFVIAKTQSMDILNGLFLVPQYPIECAPDLWDLNEEFEGLVFKNSQAPWGAPFGRMKRAVTMDYVCMGFEQSDADRHRGWGVASMIGGLLPASGEAPVAACNVCTFTDEQRRAFFDRPEQYIGRVFEAQGKKITKRGSLRHPDFVRWRNDKTPDECVWTKETK